MLTKLLSKTTSLQTKYIVKRNLILNLRCSKECIVLACDAHCLCGTSEADPLMCSGSFFSPPWAAPLEFSVQIASPPEIFALMAFFAPLDAFALMTFPLGTCVLIYVALDMNMNEVNIEIARNNMRLFVIFSRGANDLGIDFLSFSLVRAFFLLVVVFFLVTSNIVVLVVTIFFPFPLVSSSS
ncbi:hypothetical protein Droror1_Dr00021380 [Drosera rotundifolia]